MAGFTAGFLRGTLQTSGWAPVLWFALAGLFGQGLGRLAAFYGIERMGVSRSSPITASSPLWAVLLAFTFLGERPGVAVYLGTLCVVGGVFLLSIAVYSISATAAHWSPILILPVGAAVRSVYSRRAR